MKTENLKTQILGNREARHFAAKRLPTILTDYILNHFLEIKQGDNETKPCEKRYI